MRFRSGVLLLAVGVVLVGLACAGAGDDNARLARERRVHEQLAFDPPFRLIGIAFLDDGGTGVASIADDDDTINVWEDDSMFSTRSVPEFGSVEPPIPRHVWLGAHPRFPGSRELAYSSAAESAVVDLLHLQVQALVSARDESTLVRDERKARSNRDHDAWGVWQNKLSPKERDVMQLRMLISQIEFRRAEGAKGPP